MVNLFGDWLGDFTVILIVFIIFLIYYLFINREKKSNYKVGLLASLIILGISGFQLIGTVVFWDIYFGPDEGLWVTGIIFFVSILTTIKSAVEFSAEHDKN